MKFAHITDQASLEKFLATVTTAEELYDPDEKRTLLMHLASLDEKKRVLIPVYINSVTQDLLRATSSYKGSDRDSGRTEAMVVFGYAAPEVQLAYIQIRGETLKDTANLQGIFKETEGMLVFRNAAPEVQLAYIQIRGQTLKDTAKLQDRYKQTEAMVVFRYAAPEVQRVFPATTRRNSFNNLIYRSAISIY